MIRERYATVGPLAGDLTGRAGPQTSPTDLRFGILGSLEAYDGDRPLHLGPFKQRLVLGMLLCQANRMVSVATLTDTLWDDDPPRTAHKNIQVYVSSLRKALGTDRGARQAGRPRLLHSPPGYVLRVGPEQLDALRFRDLARAGRVAAQGGDTAVAADLLGQALQVWRGQMLPDLASAEPIAAEADRLYEQYLTTYEDWVEAKLTLGHDADLVDGIGELLGRHPFRERLRHAQMLALHRLGRQTEALAQFESTRQMLARDLGLTPSPVLARLYESILAGVESPGAGGRAAPVGLRGEPAGRSNLPRDVADFTGRGDQVSALVEVLDRAGRGGVAVISGPAGVGKTALAVRCAHQLTGRFPDGRVLACLRAPDRGPRPIPEVLGELLRGIGLTGALPRGEEERAALLRAAVAGRETLLVLDDAVTEDQVRSILSAVGDGVVVVVTSRHHLPGLESAVHLALEPMPEAAALALLSRLVGPDRVAAEPETARRIAAVCCGLPLAIRIVGAKLAGLRHLTLARYAERLDDEGRLLDELVAGDLEMRSRLATWYQSLGPGDRATLHCLASLADTTFGASEVASSLGTDVPRAEAAIERLIEAHLVQARADDEVLAHVGGSAECYSLPSLIRVFVRQLPAA